MFRVAKDSLSLLLTARSPAVSAQTVRAASTVASAAHEVFSPAVAFLLGSKRLDKNTIGRLPRTGPKNRLLKGDVLRFLRDPSVINQSGAVPGAIATSETEAIASQAYYGSKVVVNELVTFVKNLNAERKATISVSDLFTRAAYLALQAIPEVNSRWNEQKNAKELVEPIQLLIHRLSPFGVSRMLLREPEEIGGAKLSKTFRDEGTAVENARNVFSIYDAVLSPFGDLTLDLTSKETAIFSLGSVRKVHRQEGQGHGRRDLIDFLAGSIIVQSPPRASVVLDHVKPKNQRIGRSATQDELDIMAQPGPSSFYTGSFVGECEPMVDYVVAADLIVDSRAISGNAASKFLKTWSDLLKKPQALL